ncbi:hypothetical protein ACFY9F_34080 [Streptomyces sp. NPDC012421]|uniref:hypothetical protein n=1 Tax=Streptomyces sp. NPDC012421 TaxID=3364832 RepID=UPI0036EFFC11
MGVFAMFRRKKKGTAEDVAEVSPASPVAEADAPDAPVEAAEDDGPVTRVPVAGVTVPEPARDSAPEPAPDSAPGSVAESETESAVEAVEGVEAVEVVEIPRQQSAETAADASPEVGSGAEADPDSHAESGTGEAAHR